MKFLKGVGKILKGVGEILKGVGEIPKGDHEIPKGVGEILKGVIIFFVNMSFRCKKDIDKLHLLCYNNS